MTLQQLQDRLALYLAAEAKILLKQEYTIGAGQDTRRLRYADLAEVRTEIASINTQIAAAQTRAMGGRRVFRMVPG